METIIYLITRAILAACLVAIIWETFPRKKARDQFKDDWI
jgi:hypothetical protein